MKRILLTYLLLLILPAISIASDLTDFTGVGGDYKDGGDIAGADRTLGSTDNFDLGFITNDITRIHIQGDGKIGIGTETPLSQVHIFESSTSATPNTNANNFVIESDIGQVGMTFLGNDISVSRVWINFGDSTDNDKGQIRYDLPNDIMSFRTAMADRMSIIADGTVDVVGVFTAGTKTFKIDHPLDPTNKILYHGVVESPRFDLIYRGITNLVNGRATIDIDNASDMTSGTFAALTQNVVVTSLQNQTSFGRVRPGPIAGANFDIIAEDTTSTDIIAWVVMAERHDAFAINLVNTDAGGQLIPEVDKEVLTQAEVDSLKDITINNAAMDKVVYENVDIGADKKGYYRHPEAYGATRPTRKVTYTTLP